MHKSDTNPDLQGGSILVGEEGLKIDIWDKKFR